MASIPPRIMYVSCQKPVPPESRRKFFHQIRCGSERVHWSSESRSRQYWRIPACIGKKEKDEVLMAQQAVRLGIDRSADLRPKADQRPEAGDAIHAHAEVNDHQIW